MFVSAFCSELRLSVVLGHPLEVTGTQQRHRPAHASHSSVVVRLEAAVNDVQLCAIRRLHFDIVSPSSALM